VRIRTLSLHGLITLGTVPHARLVEHSSQGNGSLTFKACYATAVVMGLAIAADPISWPGEVRNLLVFKGRRAFAGRLATD